jgi:endonuclease YncB( thermonuclease family)
MSERGMSLEIASARLAAAPFAYQFPAIIESWHDGDTCKVYRGVWPGVVFFGEQVRVQGINAPELSAEGGAEARDFARKIAPAGTAITLICTKEDKYGRLLARVILPDGSDFSSVMIANGQAKAYLE